MCLISGSDILIRDVIIVDLGIPVCFDICVIGSSRFLGSVNATLVEVFDLGMDLCPIDGIEYMLAWCSGQACGKHAEIIKSGFGINGFGILCWHITAF